MPPHFLPGLRVISSEKASDPSFTTAYARDHESFDSQWRGRDTKTRLVICDLRLPSNRTRLAVQRDETTAEWRRRCIAEYGDPNFIDPL